MNSSCGQSESGVARAIVGSDSVSRFLPPPNKGRRSTSSKSWINMYKCFCEFFSKNDHSKLNLTNFEKNEVFSQFVKKPRNTFCRLFVTSDLLD